METETGVGGAPRPDEFGLPGGWLVRRRLGPGSPGLELLDPDGACLAALNASNRPALSIERAWRGVGYGEGALHWWAVVMGRAAPCAPLSVTFTGRKPQSSPGRRGAVPVRTVVTPAVGDGLWLAAVPGLQFAVTCRQGTRVIVRHIQPLPGRWPLAQRYGEEETG